MSPNGPRSRSELILRCPRSTHDPTRTVNPDDPSRTSDSGTFERTTTQPGPRTLVTHSGPRTQVPLTRRPRILGSRTGFRTPVGPGPRLHHGPRYFGPTSDPSVHDRTTDPGDPDRTWNPGTPGWISDTDHHNRTYNPHVHDQIYDLKTPDRTQNPVILGQT